MRGGNPAGVVLIDTLPRAEEMQTVAADVGFSETVFAEPLGDHSSWRVRYFSPESEVPFCGHATIALGAALAGKYGDGRFALHLNTAKISVEGAARDGGFVATLLSPPTHSEAGAGVPLDEVLGLFGFTDTQLDPHIPPARIHGGADHIVLALRSRDDLASMQYDLDAGLGALGSVISTNPMPPAGLSVYTSSMPSSDAAMISDEVSSASGALSATSKLAMRLNVSALTGMADVANSAAVNTDR